MQGERICEIASSLRGKAAKHLVKFSGSYQKFKSETTHFCSGVFVKVAIYYGAKL